MGEGLGGCSPPPPHGNVLMGSHLLHISTGWLHPQFFDEVTGLPKNDPTWYRPGMPEYVASTHFVSPCNLIDFMRFRCGSHSLAIATRRWHNCPREERICQKCTANEVEDEYHVMFRWSAYESLRVAMHTQCKLFLDPSDGVFGRFDLAALCGCRTLNFCFVCLFDCVGGIHRAKRAGDAGMSKFMNQSPRHVARYVSECMQLRETKPDLRRHFEEYHVDLFSSSAVRSVGPAGFCCCCCSCSAGFSCCRCWRCLRCSTTALVSHILCPK